MTSPLPSISIEGKKELVRLLEEAAEGLPGCALAVANGSELLFEHYTGRYDVLGTRSRSINKDTRFFFASTTKLLTSVAILQLVDRGLIELSTPASRYFPQLATPLRVFVGTEQGEATYRYTNTEITVAMLLNQSAGFGGEFRDQVVAFKSTLKPGEPGAGFVNSCKVENLVNTPVVEEPGEVYQYGNCCEWLGLLVQAVTKQSLEDYMQENIFRPLKMHKTTFYPFEGEALENLMPLRWYNSETGLYEVFEKQHPGMKLPRNKADIEYAVGGGGIYSTVADYVLLLQHLLSHYTAPSTTSSSLVGSQLSSLFQPSLAASARKNLTATFGEWYEAKEDGELDWTTGMCLYNKTERRGGWSRRQGSVGWMGAASTEYFIDPKSGIAFVFSSNLLPHTAPMINEIKVKLEKALYAHLEE